MIASSDAATHWILPLGVAATFVVVARLLGDLSSSQDCTVGGKEFVIVAALLGGGVEKCVVAELQIIKS